MNGSNPSLLVSICVPVYNGEEYLRSAMLSAIGQTYRPLEIVVSDDKSSDRSIAIIEEVSTKTDIPVKILSHEPAGIGANWNNCIRNSSGRYVKFLFQDDLLRPECVKEMVQLAEQDSDIGLVFSERQVLYDSSDPYHTAWMQRHGNLQLGWQPMNEINHGDELLGSPNLLKYSLNKIGEPTTVLIRKSVFDKIGYFNETLKQILDVEFYYRVMNEFKVGYISRELAAFRLHVNQTSSINRTSGAVNETLALYKFLRYSDLFKKLHVSVRFYLFVRFSKAFKLYKKLVQS